MSSSTPPDDGPRAAYSHRLDARRAETTLRSRIDRTIANVRLGVAGIGLLVAWLALGAQALSLLWLLVPVLVFFALVVVHERTLQRLRRAERATRFYEDGLRRLDNRWAGNGNPGEAFQDPHHPYAADLDLFGSGSLFERLCAARTRTGEEMLAAWLLAPAALDTVRARQVAVAELRGQLDLREELALLGEEARDEIHPAALIAWGDQPAAVIPRWIRPAAALLGAGGAVGFILWVTGGTSLPLILFFVAGQALELYAAGRFREGVKGAGRTSRDLELLASLLASLEQGRFEAPLLRGLRDGLASGGSLPSQQVARLQGLLGLLDSQRNLFFAFFARLLLWSTQLGIAIEAWRAQHGPHLAGWLTAVGEFEALNSLAGYAYERPADPFPELVEPGPWFEAEALAHPLLPDAVAVPNDVQLGGELRLLIVSGSNMSGKSTLLRTIGTNVVLGLAGAPVRARKLVLSPMSVGASLRIQDSLQAGTSRFYAEILRLRQVVDLASGPLPLLFLLDEILHGTNSHDRRIGAQAVLRTLVSRGAVGLATTHDLALTQIVEELGAHAANIHFEDHLEDGQMRFDYHLRPGVVRKSNALALMRAVGLEV